MMAPRAPRSAITEITRASTVNDAVEEVVVPTADKEKSKRTSYPFALCAKRLYQGFCADDRFDPRLSWCKQVAKERTKFIERVLKAVPDTSSYDVERWALTFAKKSSADPQRG